jgi:hypothetical protein
MSRPEDVEIRMDPQALYREEVFTDRRVGTIRQLVPVRSDGSADLGRPVLFIGQAQMLLGGSMLPLSFEIEATTLSDAMEKYGPAAKQALEETLRELQEIRRQAASSLIIPDAGATASIVAAGTPGALGPRPRRG